MLYLDGYNFFNSPTTVIWKDKSIYGNHATLYNMSLTTTSGSNGTGGVITDGTDDYIKGYFANTISSNNFTIELKIGTANSGSGYNSMFNIFSSGKNIMTIQRRNGTQLYVTGNAGTNTLFNFTCDLSLHIIQIASSTTILKVWLDGILIINTTRSFSLSTNLDTMYLGAYSNGQGYSNTIYDFVRIYNRTLSDTEIASNYNASL
jgi:hypothetical protein